jgi:hypothetical protein
MRRQTPLQRRAYEEKKKDLVVDSPDFGLGRA